VDNLLDLKQRYVESTIQHGKALAIGDSRTANKHAKILNKVFQQLNATIEGKNVLVELLYHNTIRVRSMAAIDLLRINYEVQKAEKALELIASLDQTVMQRDERITVFAAQIQLKSWKENGFVS